MSLNFIFIWLYGYLILWLYVIDTEIIIMNKVKYKSVTIMQFGLLLDIAQNLYMSIGSLNLLRGIGWILYNYIKIFLSNYKII